MIWLSRLLINGSASIVYSTVQYVDARMVIDANYDAAGPSLNEGSIESLHTVVRISLILVADCDGDIK